MAFCLLDALLPFDGVFFHSYLSQIALFNLLSLDCASDDLTLFHEQTHPTFYELKSISYYRHFLYKLSKATLMYEHGYCFAYGRETCSTALIFSLVSFRPIVTHCKLIVLLEEGRLVSDLFNSRIQVTAIAVVGTFLPDKKTPSEMKILTLKHFIIR